MVRNRNWNTAFPPSLCLRLDFTPSFLTPLPSLFPGSRWKWRMGGGGCDQGIMVPLCSSLLYMCCSACQENLLQHALSAGQSPFRKHLPAPSWETTQAAMCLSCSGVVLPEAAGESHRCKQWWRCITGTEAFSICARQNDLGALLIL